MSGDVVLVEAKEQVTQILDSMSHGTGRACRAAIANPSPTHMISRAWGNRFLFQLVWKTLRYGLMGRSRIGT